MIIHTTIQPFFCFFYVILGGDCESVFLYRFFFSALIQTVGILGPMFGFMLESFCAKLYVDIGALDLDIHLFVQLIMALCPTLIICQ